MRWIMNSLFGMIQQLQIFLDMNDEDVGTQRIKCHLA